jgi:hypothetical protein
MELQLAGMARLGPGGNAHTRQVLPLLQEPQFQIVVDAG